MDFDSPTAAQKAVTALKASGVQAQMAKVLNNKPCVQSEVTELIHVKTQYVNTS